jgi:hypothetical protein
VFAGEMEAKLFQNAPVCCSSTVESFMACNVVRLCDTEVLCTTHKSVLRNNYVALGEHSHNYGGNLLDPHDSQFVSQVGNVKTFSEIL